MHIAAAMGVPFVALFGPTDPDRHLPPSRKFKVIHRELSCSPCYSSHCKILTHACMKDISAEEVAGELMQLMEVKK
jgi:ADP-heptose:LPS heptosyltransferase